ncbi:sce7726 family protein [Solidesulfovibrio carbinolicus]|uniref:sce7726 family protein n=1 Tax=Solidesulfovibrio carbinolicus TaxID=296842 RepID=UPI001012F133|nr:sce7726 family protein [Solidesulfovibrio carbinolicus]
MTIDKIEKRVGTVRDREIRQTLHAKVLRKFHADPRTRVFDEFGLCTGLTRVDVAVVNGALHGFEIKSDQDNLSRLPSQVCLYSKVLDFSTLVVGESHLDAARSLLPRWWGVIVVTCSKNNTPILKWERRSCHNPSLDPLSVAQLLWRREALLILEAHSLSKGLRAKPRNVLWEILAREIKLNELCWLVRQAIKNRGEWRDEESSFVTPRGVENLQILAQI